MVSVLVDELSLSAGTCPQLRFLYWNGCKLRHCSSSIYRCLPKPSYHSSPRGGVLVVPNACSQTGERNSSSGLAVAVLRLEKKTGCHGLADACPVRLPQSTA